MMAPDSHRSSSPPRAPTKRGLAKAQTRQRILAAARSLFVQGGLENTTVRGIVQQAGLSTGALFANFNDKFELFEQLLEEDRAAVLDIMRLARAKAIHVADAVNGMLAARLEFYCAQTPLLRAALGLEWMRSPESVSRTVRAAEDVRAEITQALEAAMERGELAPATDIGMLSSLLHDINLAALRSAVLTGDALDDIRSCQKRRIEMIIRACMPDDPAELPLAGAA